MQSGCHVANLSSTASGVVGDGCTGSEHSGHVVDHSPSASGVVGGGSTGPKSFAVLPADQVQILGFSDGIIEREQVQPMTVGKNDKFRPYVDEGNTLCYAGNEAFEEHSRRTYRGRTLHSIFSNLF